MSACDSLVCCLQHRARSRPGMAGNFHLGQQMKVTGDAGPGPGAVPRVAATIS
jgi:hypothetical protein